MPEPLLLAAKLAELNTLEELEVFYEEDIAVLCGEDRIEPIRMKLMQERRQGGFFKGLLVRHSGVGKSTEINRLARVLGEAVEPVWISATRDLDRSAFKPFDPILLACASRSRSFEEVSLPAQTTLSILHNTLVDEYEIEIFQNRYSWCIVAYSLK